MNATHIQRLIEPQGGGSISEGIQNNLDQVIAQRAATGTPMIQHLNHPNFGWAISLEDMKTSNGVRFFEVYNGHPAIHNMRDSVHLDTETLWDLLNISYLAHGKPLLYGLATDDSHHYHQKGARWSNAGRGWVMVQADTLSPPLIQAMEAGNFYASTGVTLETLAQEDRTLTVGVKPEEGINYTISFFGCKKGEDATRVLQETKDTTAVFEFPEDLLFVRCKILSSKLQDNPIEDLLYERAWTQPVTGF